MPRRGLCNEEIMKAAAKLVAEKGYDNFSLRELAARLGVQPASLYNHVKGIDEINMKLGLRAAKLLNHRLSDAVSGRLPDEAFVSAAYAYRDFALQNPELYKALMRMPASDDEKILQAAWESFSPMRELLFGYGADKKETVDLLRGLRSAMHGFVSLIEAGFMQHHETSTVEESYDSIIRGFLKALKTISGRERYEKI